MPANAAEPKVGSASSSANDDDDVLEWGAAAMAPHINRTTRQTFYLLERGLIDGACKIGDQWTARRRALRQVGAAGGK